MNNWILHCKEYCKTHNVPYQQALKEAGSTYKKQQGTGVYNTDINTEETNQNEFEN